jgi:hypothetical protein
MFFSNWFNPFRHVTRGAIVRTLRKNPGAYYRYSGVNPGYLMLEHGELVRYGVDVFAGPRTDKMKSWFDKNLLHLYSGAALRIENATIDRLLKELAVEARRMPSDVWVPVINNHFHLWGVKAYDVGDYNGRMRWNQLDANGQPIGEDRFIPRELLTPAFYDNMCYLRGCVTRAKDFSKWDHVTKGALPLDLPEWIRVQATSESDAALQCNALPTNGGPLAEGVSIRAKFDVMLDPSFLDTVRWLEIDLHSTLETVMEKLTDYYPAYVFGSADFNLSAVLCVSKDWMCEFDTLAATEYDKRIQCRSVPGSSINCI